MAGDPGILFLAQVRLFPEFQNHSIAIRMCYPALIQCWVTARRMCSYPSRSYDPPCESRSLTSSTTLRPRPAPASQQLYIPDKMRLRFSRSMCRRKWTLKSDRTVSRPTTMSTGSAVNIAVSIHRAGTNFSYVHSPSWPDRTTPARITVTLALEHYLHHCLILSHNYSRPDIGARTDWFANRDLMFPAPSCKICLGFDAVTPNVHSAPAPTAAENTPLNCTNLTPAKPQPTAQTFTPDRTLLVSCFLSGIQLPWLRCSSISMTTVCFPHTHSSTSLWL